MLSLPTPPTAHDTKAQNFCSATADKPTQNTVTTDKWTPKPKHKTADRADLVGLRADKSALAFVPDVALGVGAGPQQRATAALLHIQVERLHVCSKHVVPERQAPPLAACGQLYTRHDTHVNLRPRLD